MQAALHNPSSRPVSLLLEYTLELARYDPDYDLRDRSRLLRHFIRGAKVGSPPPPPPPCCRYALC
jgi:hypothetical protein